MLFFTRDRSGARGQQPLTPPGFPSLNVLEAHPRQSSDRARDASPEAELPPLGRTGSHHPTNRDASQRAHENLPELSSKMSTSRNTNTSNYIGIVGSRAHLHLDVICCISPHLERCTRHRDSSRRALRNICLHLFVIFWSVHVISLLQCPRPRPVDSKTESVRSWPPT